jgi:hypothetical protein
MLDSLTLDQIRIFLAVTDAGLLEGCETAEPRPVGGNLRNPEA